MGVNLRIILSLFHYSKVLTDVNCWRPGPPRATRAGVRVYNFKKNCSSAYTSWSMEQKYTYMAWPVASTSKHPHSSHRLVFYTMFLSPSFYSMFTAVWMFHLNEWSQYHLLIITILCTYFINSIEHRVKNPRHLSDFVVTTSNNEPQSCYGGGTICGMS